MEDDVEEVLDTDNEDDEDDAPVPEVIGKSSIRGGTVVSVPHPQSVVSVYPAPTPQGTGDSIPHYIKAAFRDVKTMTWHQLLVIVLPSGVGLESSKDVKLEVLFDNNVLAITDIWPVWLTSLEFLCFLKQSLLQQAAATWKDLEPMEKDQAEDQWRDMFAMMSGAIQEKMLLMRREEYSPTLKSTAHIPLDFPVKPVTPADWTFFGNDAGVRVLFVDLKAPNEKNYQEDPDKELVIAKLQKKDV